MRAPRLSALAFALVAAAFMLPAAAHATNVQGTLPSNTTWDPTGNPWTIIGDVTVPSGVTLTITPGTSVVFASGDTLGSGADTTKTELIINGSLSASGTSSQGINVSIGSGYGVVVAGTATLDYATVSGGSYGIRSSGTVTANNSVVSGSTYGLYVTGGTTTFNSGTLKNGTYGAYSTGGTLTLAYDLVTGNSTAGVRMSAPGSIDHSTFTGNSTYGIYVPSFTGSATLTNNVVSSNGTYGIYFSSPSSPSPTVHHNDVWGQSTDLYNVSNSSGGLTANPLFVSSSNLRLTEYSPARFGASDGSDLGALAYISDPTPALEGILWTSKTLTGSNTLAGDLTVAGGKTLTLAPGATINFGTSDGLGSGADPSKVELIVNGTLSASGTSSSGITLNEGTGYGVVNNGGTITFDYATLSSGSYGIRTLGGTTTANNCTISGATYGLYSSGGTTTFNSGTLKNGTYGAYTTGGTLNLAYDLVTGNSTAGVRMSAPGTVDHSTFTGNSTYGIYVPSFTGTATLTNNVVSQNGTYGIYFSSPSSPSPTVHHNDVWGQSTDLYNVSNSSGGLTANPLFVSSSNLRLTEYSPARFGASDGSDLGALAYISDPTPALEGILWTSKTLSGSNTLAGDFTVAGGKTLTLAPGATINFGSTDNLGSGFDTSKVELIVNGTLNASGTSSQGITLNQGTGYGVVNNGGNVTFDYATISSGSYGIRTLGGATVANNCTISGATYGLYTSGGTTTFNSGELKNGTYGAYSTGGTLNLAYDLVTGNSTAGVRMSAPGTVDHSTFTGNSTYGIYVPSFTGAATLTNNVVSQNGTYGIYFSSPSSPSPTVHHNDVWGQSTDLYNVSNSSGGLTANPLFVSSSNLRLTEYSPARFGASDGSDLGALAYISDPTPALEGILWTSKTLSGSNTLAGDFTVAGGKTLTLAPGASLSFGSTDNLGSGFDTSKVELIVNGTLNASGTAASGITLTQGSGYGVVNNGGNVTFDYATLSGGSYGVRTLGGTTNANNSTISGATYGLYTTGGTTTFNSGTLSGGTYGVYSTGGTVNLAYDLIKANSTAGVRLSSPATLSHNTITENSTYGIYVPSFTGTVTITDNISSSNGTYGAYFSSASTPSRTFHHNDVWGQSTDLYNVSGGTGAVSANPLFVSPGFNYTLQATSPCRNVASDGTDIGAFPYAPVGVDHITVTPASSTVAVNASVTFTATAYDASNNPLPSTTFTWSANPSAGTVTSGGVFTASCAPGTYASAVTASAQGKSGSASVTVNTGPAASVTVTPSTVSLAPNGQQQFNAAVADACGNALGSAPVSWLVVAGGGTISTGGLFTAGGTSGTFNNTVKATSGTVSGFASVTVQSAGLATIDVSPMSTSVAINGTQQFTATGKDASGNPVTLGAVTWSVVNGGGSISSSGLFTAGTAAGTFTNTVRATSGTISGYATVTVTPGAISTVTVTPSNPSVSISGAQQFSAVAKDAGGNTVTTTFSWSVVAGGGAINASTGMFTAGTTPGTFNNTVKATAGGVSGYASVTVSAGSATSLAVSPASTTIGISGTQQFTATGKDSAGNTVPVTVTWSVVAGGGSINASGLFTAGTSPGTYTNTVKATSGSLTAFATVTVQAGALASLVVTPASASLAVNGTQQFTVIGKDAAGNTVSVTPTWSVVNGGGAISASGLFTAGTASGSFANTVKAVANGTTAFASVDVTAGAVQTVDVTPKTVSLSAHQTQQFSATAKDQYGNTVNGTITWSMGQATAGTVNSSGLFTASGVAGSYAGAVKATLSGVSGSADVSITAGPLATITVTPLNPTVVAGAMLQFSASGADADGNTVAITPSWAALNGVGSIDQTGKLKAGTVPGPYVDSITATANGKTGKTTVTISAGNVAKVTISPENPLLAVKGTVTFTAHAWDAFDNELQGLSSTWTVVNGGGTIDGQGVFTAGSESGTFMKTVQATVGGVSATTDIVISADFDKDGLPDVWELANGLDPNDATDAHKDDDGDQLDNAGELLAKTNPHDADTDDDGVIDGLEQKPAEDTDGDGLTNALDPDSDNDGILDGTEMAVATANADTDLTKKTFVPDADPSTSTNPLSANTDGDARADGEEDLNHNGRIDPGETDPNTAETFCDSDAVCGGGNHCEAPICKAGEGQSNIDANNAGSGCGCDSSSGGAATVFAALFALAVLFGRRRRAVGVVVAERR